MYHACVYMLDIKRRFRILCSVYLYSFGKEIWIFYLIFYHITYVLPMHFLTKYSLLVFKLIYNKYKYCNDIPIGDNYLFIFCFFMINSNNLS